MFNFFMKSIKDIEVCYDFKNLETRRRVNIVIIDDEGFDPSLSTVLNNNGFVIQVMNDVSNLMVLSAYEIILCDIRGVGLSVSPEYEGAGLIKAIKEQYPTKYLISYTGSDIDPNFNRMLKYADNSIAKDADRQAWIDLLSEAVRVVIDPVEKWKALSKYLISKGVSTSTIMKIEDNYVRKLLDKEVLFPFPKLRKSLSSDMELILTNVAFPLITVLLKSVS